MAVLVCVVLILAMFGVSDGAWCVCRSDMSDSVLQKSLDYACGAGADCNPILSNGACFQPNTVRSHCSYAVNSYYQRKGQAQGACDFAGSAGLTATDPSSNGCTYPATPSAAGTTSTPSTTNASGSTSTTPTTFSPPGSVLGGLGPSGNTISSDSSDGGLPPEARILLQLLAILFSVMVYFSG
ncbi:PLASMODESMATA CALLOSE-BINDING PROTEIN 2-like [Typha latifolia]|uniref:PLASMODESMATA CALLOSE-BINDING PROTEIN 2-like n=1 Tax=Typha latifolia TaxID=4733 RepID=UPI003C2D03FE